VQRATAQSKTRIFRDFGVAEASPGFQAGWSDCMYLFSFYFLSLCSSCPLIWVFRVSFCTYDGTLPFRSCGLCGNMGRVIELQPNRQLAIELTPPID
jgi:hypothetical protein